MIIIIIIAAKGRGFVHGNKVVSKFEKTLNNGKLEWDREEEQTGIREISIPAATCN